jgi:hypothetical protein
MPIRNFTFVGWSWSAVFAGVIASLVFQVLLVMVGLGLGLLSVDVPTAESAPKAVSWAVFTWWAVSGVMSAFVGGWVAANFSDTFTPEGRATHGLMAWALATLIVVGAAAFASTGSFANNLMGPAATTMAQYNRLSAPPAQTTGQARPTQAQLEAARRNLALAMIGSFVALLIGASAAIAGSQWLPDVRTTRDVRMP